MPCCRAVQQFMPELGIPPERIVFITGIGCAGRFAYYMDTYGMHGIHGRAPALATGLASARDDLSIWVVSGDGDSLSIGGNHLIHALRRNVPVKILLFNNQIYGLTKGQASPTSELGKITKSTPFGVADHPFNPVALAIGAEATFVARTLDRDRHHMTDVLRAAAQHEGAALVEIYQNCPVFNDGAFCSADREGGGDANQIRLEPGSRSASEWTASAAWRWAATVHSRSSTSPASGRMRCSCTIPGREDPGLAFSLAKLSRDPTGPTPIGVFRDVSRPVLVAMRAAPTRRPRTSSSSCSPTARPGQSCPRTRSACLHGSLSVAGLVGESAGVVGTPTADRRAERDRADDAGQGWEPEREHGRPARR